MKSCERANLPAPGRELQTRAAQHPKKSALCVQSISRSREQYVQCCEQQTHCIVCNKTTELKHCENSHHRGKCLNSSFALPPPRSPSAHQQASSLAHIQTRVARKASELDAKRKSEQEKTNRWPPFEAESREVLSSARRSIARLRGDARTDAKRMALRVSPSKSMLLNERVW